MLARHGVTWCALSMMAAGCNGPLAADDDVGVQTAALNEDGSIQKIEVPLVVVLWQNANFGGHKRVFVQDQPTLAAGNTTPQEECVRVSDDQELCSFVCAGGPDFNDAASAVGVHPGPDYQSFVARTGRQPTVTLWENEHGRGRSLKLAAGVYPSLASLGFNDAVSSLAIDDVNTRDQATIQPSGPAATIASIPFVVSLHSAALDRIRNCQEADTVITLVESSSDLGADFGFDNVTSGVSLLRGSGGLGAKVRLYTETNRSGSSIVSSTFGGWAIDQAGFGDLPSSVEIVGPVHVFDGR